MPLASDPTRLVQQLLFEEATSSSAHSVNTLLADREIVVYGGGDGFITFSVFVLQKYGLRPILLLDCKYAKPTEVNGIPACSPHSHHPTPAECQAAVVVVTVGKRDLHADIFACLKELGYANIVLASDIFEYHLSHAPRGFETFGPEYYRDRRDAILGAYELMADDLSRTVFASLLRIYVERRPRSIPSDPLANQYFPDNIALHRGYARVVNCGSYDGDTVRRLHELHGKVDALACFEPDPQNFAALTNYLQRMNSRLADEVLAFPCGIHRDELQLRFQTGNRINSTLADSGDIVVQCVALDHALPVFRPTFVNMDIEGAEPDALVGATQMIQAYRPDLAICVYHHPAHLWEIPLRIHAMNPGYLCYLRNYTSFPAETVAYATDPALSATC